MLRQLALLLAETGIATENQRPLFHMKVYRIANQKNTTENKLNTCNRLQILDRISLNTHQTQTNERFTQTIRKTHDTRNERTLHERTK